jgi:hypothetical protein
MTGLTINFLAVSHFEHEDHDPLILNVADKPVISDPVAP